MKTQLTNLFNQVSNTEIKDLTTIVKETLALDHNYSRPKVFSAAELWNIQRRHRSLNQRRRLA
jgi:hypothetical protein